MLKIRLKLQKAASVLDSLEMINHIDLLDVFVFC